jgi:Tfp pilus assembly protein PilN
MERKLTREEINERLRPLRKRRRAEMWGNIGGAVGVIAAIIAIIVLYSWAFSGFSIPVRIIG